MSNSNYLLINGSPNKQGHSMTFAQTVFDYLPLNVMHAYDININPCDDCKVCHHKLGCKHKDAMNIVIEHLIEADHLIIVSPIYFGALTDQLMKIFNRFQQLFEAKFTHQKPVTTFKTITLLSTAAATDKMFDGAKLTLSILKSLFDAKKTFFYGLTDTDTITDIRIAYKDKLSTIKSTLKKELI